MWVMRSFKFFWVFCLLAVLIGTIHGKEGLNLKGRTAAGRPHGPRKDVDTA